MNVYFANSALSFSISLNPLLEREETLLIQEFFCCISFSMPQMPFERYLIRKSYGQIKQIVALEIKWASSFSIIF